MSSTNTFKTITNFLDEKKWPWKQLPGRAVVSFLFTGDSERWQCYVESLEEREQVLAYSVAPFNVPLEIRPKMTEYLMRANYGLIVGNFELDFKDGEIRFKTSLDAKGASSLDQKLVERLVIVNLHAMNTYLPGIIAIMDGDQSPPAEILSRVED